MTKAVIVVLLLPLLISPISASAKLGLAEQAFLEQITKKSKVFKSIKQFKNVKKINVETGLGYLHQTLGLYYEYGNAALGDLDEGFKIPGHFYLHVGNEAEIPIVDFHEQVEQFKSAFPKKFKQKNILARNIRMYYALALSFEVMIFAKKFRDQEICQRLTNEFAKLSSHRLMGSMLSFMGEERTREDVLEEFDIQPFLCLGVKQESHQKLIFELFQAFGHLDTFFNFDRALTRSALMQEVARLRPQLVKVKEMCVASMEKNKALQESGKLQTELIKKLQQQLAVEKGRFSGLQKTHSRKMSDKKKAEQARDALKRELAEVRRQLAAFKKQASQPKPVEVVKGLREELANKDLVIEDLRSSNTELSVRIEALQSTVMEHSKILEEVKDLRQRLHNGSRDRKQIEQENSALQRAMESLRGQLQKAQAKILNQRFALQGQSEALRGYKEKQGQDRNKIAALEKEVRKLKMHRSLLKKTLGEYRQGFVRNLGVSRLAFDRWLEIKALRAEVEAWRRSYGTSHCI